MAIFNFSILVQQFSKQNVKKKVCSNANPEIIFHAVHPATFRFTADDGGDDVSDDFS
jgi:hypothetical protein